jgi:hydrogenase maturation protein HypF
MKAYRIRVRGAVQGVGFRPFVYRLARRINVAGSVRNTGEGVEIDAEAPLSKLEEFIAAIKAEHPPLCTIDAVTFQASEPLGLSQFEILASDAKEASTATVLPDIATCDCGDASL